MAGVNLRSRFFGPILESLQRQFRRWRKTSLDLLFPPRCAYCDADLPDSHDNLLLCDRCREVLGPKEWPSCRCCGASAPANLPPPERCPSCRGMHFQFDSVVSLGGYQGELRDAILRMKRPGSEPLSAATGRLFSQVRGTWLESFRPTVVVPVPMHWLRRLMRKTNSPEIVATEVGRALGVPVLNWAIRRRRNTRQQKNLPLTQRFENVRGAFGLADRYNFENSRVVVLDDVMTTGATCNEIAKALKKAGATTVVVAVLARAERDDKR